MSQNSDGNRMVEVGRNGLSGLGFLVLVVLAMVAIFLCFKFGGHKNNTESAAQVELTQVGEDFKDQPPAVVETNQTNAVSVKMSVRGKFEE